MKRKQTLALLIALTMIVSMFLASCGKTQTLETMIENDTEVKEEIQSTADSAGMDINVTGNEVKYTYDISNVAGITDETGKSDQVKESLTSGLENASGTFVNIASQLEEQTGIEGITVVVEYTYKGETLVTRTFTKEG